MSNADEDLPIEISVADVHALVEQNAPMLLLDCREENEHEVVSMAESTLIPMSQLEQRASELDGEREQHIVVFCHFGGRANRRCGNG